MKPSKNITARRQGLPRHAALALAAAYSFVLAGCHQDMWNQPRYTSLQKNDFFADGAADRLPVPNTIPYDAARRGWVSHEYETLTGQAQVPSLLEDVFWTGKLDDGTPRPDNYFSVDMALLKRGQERYTATCALCHGEAGYGNGMIVQRGFPAPPSLHIDRLREIEDGYFVDVINNGFGRMYSYRARVSAEDRWAIAAYIRALQYSQNVPKDALEEADRAELEKALNSAPEAAQQPVENNAH